MTWTEVVTLSIVALVVLTVIGFPVISVVSLERRTPTIERDWACAIHGECKP